MQSPTTTNCNERSRLAADYAMATREYSEAVVNFLQVAGRVSGQEYRRLRCVVDEALRRSEDAGATFEQHTSAHGCGNSADGCLHSADRPAVRSQSA